VTLNPGIHGPGLVWQENERSEKPFRNIAAWREEWKDPLQENQEGIEERASLYVFFKGKMSRDFCENSRR
jgi:hypothetical protein